MGLKITVCSDNLGPQSDWYQCNQYSGPVIQDITDPSGGNVAKLLTAIPSPFARVHLFETAFDFVNKLGDHNGQTVYHKLVSECLDVFELIFNLETHIKNGLKLEVISWDISRLSNLTDSKFTGHQLFGKTLDLFIKKDFPGLSNLYLITYQDDVIAGSSPLTIFFTKPELKNINITKINSGKKYFSEIIPLHKREDNFQIYLSKLFFSYQAFQNNAPSVFKYVYNSKNYAETSVQSQIKKLSSYGPNLLANDYQLLLDSNNNTVSILGCNIYQQGVNISGILSSPLVINSLKIPQDLSSTPPLILKKGLNYIGNPEGNIAPPIKDFNPLANRIIPGTQINYPFIVRDDFFEDYLLKLSFPINHTKFVTGSYDGIDSQKDDGFLIPLKMEYFNFFDIDDLENNLEFTKKNNNDVEVSLKIPLKGGGYEVFRKIYSIKESKPENGRIVEIKINLGIFPFLKVISANQNDNDFYKVMFIDEQRESFYKDKSFQLSFYSGQNLIPEGHGNYYYTKYQRTDKSNYAGSTYYEIRNTCFDIIEITTPELLSITNKDKAKGLLIPKWIKKTIGNKEYHFAVDFGTTNSHIAYIDKSNESLKARPFTIGEDDLQVVLLNLPGNDDTMTLTQRYEDLSNTPGTLYRQIHEFIPSIIGEGSRPEYKFPMRTAISEIKNFNDSNCSLLGNINIAFSYENDPKLKDEEIRTNIKWSLGEHSNQERVNIFFREILYLIRNKVILNDGDPKKVRLVWFRPLSLNENGYRILNKYWQDNFVDIFKNNNELVCLTESEAPYYYHSKRAAVFGDKPVLCIDIGGGSTDVVIFNNKKPEIGTSFNFAGNDLWGSGFNEIEHDKNIFIKKYQNLIKNKLEVKATNDTRAKIRLSNYDDYEGNGVKSEDIVSFFFAVDEYVGFSNYLIQDTELKIIFLLHYSAIIYHCVQLMKSKEIDIPSHICFSGRGSKIIDIIDVDPNKNLLIEYTQNLIEDIFNSKYKGRLNIIRAEEVKEATCNGGLVGIQQGGSNILTPAVFLGDNNFEAGNAICYKNLDDRLKSATLCDISSFFEIFFNQNNKISFKNRFGIEIDIDSIKCFISDNLAEYFEQGLDRRLDTVRPTDEINDPLFFVPMKQLLFKLSQKLNENHE